jgi:hypothetical protein
MLQRNVPISSVNNSICPVAHALWRIALIRLGIQMTMAHATAKTIFTSASSDPRGFWVCVQRSEGFFGVVLCAK